MARRSPKGRGSVYRDGDRWVAERTVDGQRVRRVRTTRDAAYAALDALNADRNQVVASRRPTVREWCEWWLGTLDVRDSTRRGYAMYVDRYIVPHLGTIKLDALNPEHVDLMLSACAQHLSPRSVAHVRAILRNALRKAQQYRRVSINAAAIVDAVKVPQGERAILTPEQARLYRESWRGNRLEALFVVAMTLGLRRSELCGLRWEDVAGEGLSVSGNAPRKGDSSRASPYPVSMLHVRQTLHRVKGEWHIEPPKSERSKRTIPLTDELVGLLRTRRAEQRSEYLATGARPDHDLVFTTPAGGYQNPDEISHAHLARIRALGLPEVSFHTLRHLAASTLASRGFSLKEVQAIMGHASITTTANVYAHTDTSSLAERMKEIGW